MNWLAILCAGAAYWVLGYVWYSLLFGKLWCAELVRHRGERPAPSGREMASKLASTFVSNLISAAAMAYVLKRTGIADMNHAIKLAAATGIGFAGTAVTMISIWESKSTTMWFIDVGYYFLGAILLATIFVCWP
jgi:hypothetical protein